MQLLIMSTIIKYKNQIYSFFNLHGLCRETIYKNVFKIKVYADYKEKCTYKIVVQTPRFFAS